ncbi:MAG: hypothetical protein IJI25_07335 [Eubacterium sp.]|nr:hypothetical protein [Eubacterium sp.]
MFEYMIHSLMNSTVFMKAIVACCFLGVLSWFVLEISYFSMVRATARIGNSKKKWLNDLKKKYEEYRRMDIKVNNVGTFVEKLFRKKKLFGLSSSFWIKLERLATAGCAISGAAGALVASQQGKDLTVVMISYITGITAACGLLFLDTFLQAEEKKHIVISNMKDYLENVLENSLGGRDGARDPSVSEAGAEKRRRILRYAEKDHGKTSNLKPVPPVTAEEEQLLEDVLQEFFA